jgi:hypothetical protein
MTQALYAHMNNKTTIKKKKKTARQQPPPFRVFTPSMRSTKPVLHLNGLQTKQILLHVEQDLNACLQLP